MEKKFRLVPEIYQYETCREFVEAFQIGEGDLILTNPSYYNPYFKEWVSEATVIYARDYGNGEPTDIMVEKIVKQIQNLNFNRVIAIGGGSIIDVSKLLIQKKILPVENLYDKMIRTEKVKDLIIVPTTCGTGSEVTNVAVIELTSKGTKMGLQTDEEYADAAILIPELLYQLPPKVFATSSIDALVHAVESYLSPKATQFSELFSLEAIRLIVRGYEKLRQEGMDSRNQYMMQFLTASTYAGIAFGNAGCAAVHAMSMAYSGTYHVAHGESNYALFTEILYRYYKLKPEGKIQKFLMELAEIFQCESSQAIQKLEELLSFILPKKRLSEYGMTEDKIPEFVKIVEEKQGRLTANNYTELSAKEMSDIYRTLL